MSRSPIDDEMPEGELPIAKEAPPATLPKVGQPPADVPRFVPRLTEPTAEYIGVGGLNLAARIGAEVLPETIDEVEAKFGREIYKTMLNDAEVARSVWTLVYSIISDGLVFSPATPQPIATLNPTPEQEAAQRDYEVAQSYSNFITRCFAGMTTPTQSVLEQVAICMLRDGMNVVETVRRFDESGGEDDGRLTLERLKSKPRESTALVVDPFMNVLGALYAKPGMANHDSIPRPDNTLPREDFAVFSFRMENNDPNGKSILRPVYNPYQLKQALWPYLGKYTAKFVVPSLAGTVAPGAQDEPVITRNEDGTFTYVYNDDGSIKHEAATDAMGRALIAFQNGSVYVGKHGSTVDIIEAQHTSNDVFGNTFRFLDGQITSGVLLQTLATTEGVHGTRAQSETHQKVLDVLVYAIRQSIADVIKNDIVKPLIRMNFGEQAVRLTPSVSLGDTERRDFATDAQATSNLVTSGFLDPSQFAGMDIQLGLPKRDLEAMQERERVRQEAINALTAERLRKLGGDSQNAGDKLAGIDEAQKLRQAPSPQNLLSPNPEK